MIADDMEKQFILRHNQLMSLLQPKENRQINKFLIESAIEDIELLKRMLIDKIKR